MHDKKALKSRLPGRKQRMFDFLKSNPVGVLASVDVQGDPHGSVIYHTVNQDLVASFLTKNGTKKYHNLVNHPNVMLVVYDAASQSVLQLTGIASEVTDNLEINQIAATVMMSSLKSSEGIPPISKLVAGAYTAFKIKPSQVRMAAYAEPNSGNYDQIFESIESFELNSPGG